MSESTRFVVDKTLERIRRRVSAGNTATVAAQAHDQSSVQPTRRPSSSATYANIPNYHPPNPSATNSSGVKIETSQAEYVQPPPNGLPTSQAPYPSSSHTSRYPYADLSVNNPQTYPNPPAFQQPRYSIPEGPQLQNTMPAQPAEPAHGVPSAVYPMSDGQMYYAAQTTTAHDWLRWSQNNFSFPNATQEYASSATALVALGGRPASTQDAMPPAIALTDDTSAWPMNLFNLGQQNGSGGA